MGVIEFKSVSYRYPDGVLALDRVSVDIEAGSFVAIVGKNGAGKSTFVKCINGLLKPTAGEVWVQGISSVSTSVAKLAKMAGLVFQNSDNQLFSPSVHDEILFSLKNSGFPKEEIEDRIESTLSLMNIAEFKDASPFLLSGGEKKRVAIASLVCMDQPIFIADEPTQGQDGMQRKNLEDMFKKMHASGKTIIVVSHDLDFIAHLSTRVLVFDQGKILLDGDVPSIFKNKEILDIQGFVPTQELGMKWFLRDVVQENNVMTTDQDFIIDDVVERVRGATKHVD
nr:ABC transporter ATP-binding protein [Candidatus Sigynarchaeota archaeon]